MIIHPTDLIAVIICVLSLEDRDAIGLGGGQRGQETDAMTQEVVRGLAEGKLSTVGIPTETSVFLQK